MATDDEMVGWHYRLIGHESGQTLEDGEGQGSLACCSPCVLSSFSRVRLFVTPWTVGCQAPLSMGFSRQEYWSGLPFPSLENLPDPGIESRSPVLQADFYHLSYREDPKAYLRLLIFLLAILIPACDSSSPGFP